MAMRYSRAAQQRPAPSQPRRQQQPFGSNRAAPLAHTGIPSHSPKQALGQARTYTQHHAAQRHAPALPLPTLASEQTGPGFEPYNSIPPRTPSRTQIHFGSIPSHPSPIGLRTALSVHQDTPEPRHRGTATSHPSQLSKHPSLVSNTQPPSLIISNNTDSIAPSRPLPRSDPDRQHGTTTITQSTDGSQQVTTTWSLEDYFAQHIVQPSTDLDRSLGSPRMSDRMTGLRIPNQDDIPPPATLFL